MRFFSLFYTHAMNCTAIACLREPLRAVDYIIVITGTNEVKCAELYVKAKSIGEPVILPKDEIDRHIEKFGSYCKL